MTTTMYCPRCETPMLHIVDDPRYPEDGYWICERCGAIVRDDESAPDYADYWCGED